MSQGTRRRSLSFSSSAPPHPEFLSHLMEDEMLDVTITAVRRPQVLRTTLDSFFKNLFKSTPCRAIINVDPVGLDVDSLRVVDVCREYFDEVVYNLPDEANFSKAFKWVWSQVESDLVFHLEDDWEMTQEVDLECLAGVLKKYRNIPYIRLPQFLSCLTTMKNWNKVFKWAGEFYMPPFNEKWLGFTGHPALLKGDFVKHVAPMLDVSLNPEKQFFQGGNTKLTEYCNQFWFVVYGVPAEPPTPPFVKDIGRAWAVENGWQKADNKAHFLKWEKVDVTNQS